MTAKERARDLQEMTKGWTVTLKMCRERFAKMYHPLKGTHENDVPVIAAEMIIAAETEAWNAAVEACIDWWANRMAKTQRNHDILDQMAKALKREPGND